jgi:hypothetical protein
MARRLIKHMATLPFSPSVQNSSVRMNFIVVIPQFQVSRTNKQSFVSVNLIYSVSIDSNLKCMREVQCNI